MRQLTSLDAQFLAMESSRTYGHVGSLALFDGAMTSEDVAAVIEGRIKQLPPFHQRLVEVPLGLDHPYWIEDRHFDLGFHIRDTAVPPPGDDSRLAETVARIFARPLDRSRPLWELYVIHGISDGRVGLLSKVHHAAVDGVSGAEVMGVMFDLEPDVPADEGTGTWRPPRERKPSELEMLGRGLLGLPRQPIRALRSLPTAIPALPDMPGAQLVPGVPQAQRVRAAVVRRLREVGPSEDLMKVRTTRAPKTRFNGRITPHRRFAFFSLKLDDVKALKNELGIKVNDVVVGLCATALRTWLLERGELPDEPLVAMIPASVRTPEERGTFGNKVTGMIVPLPTNVDDPARRLIRSHELMLAAKGQKEGLPASLMTDASNFLPPAIFSRASRVSLLMTARMRPAINVVISNVPGPAVPLYCAGQKLLGNYPVSVITDGVGLNITVMSYMDRIDFGIVVDRDMIDDAWSLKDATEAAMEELLEAVLPQSPAELAT